MSVKHFNYALSSVLRGGGRGEEGRGGKIMLLLSYYKNVQPSNENMWLSIGRRKNIESLAWKEGFQSKLLLKAGDVIPSRSNDCAAYF